MKKKMTVLAVLLLAVCVTGYSVSGTYAKYTSTIQGSEAKARVAKWAFKVNDTDVTNSFTFSLFDTVNEEDTSTTEGHVHASSGKVIAPGTGGKFTLKLSNASEVDATYTIDYTVDNAGVPLEYSINGTDWSTDLTDVGSTAINSGSDASVTIYWRWTYDVATSATNYSSRDDAADTTLGAAGSAEPKVKADIVVTQVD